MHLGEFVCPCVVYPHVGFFSLFSIQQIEFLKQMNEAVRVKTKSAFGWR